MFRIFLIFSGGVLSVLVLHSVHYLVPRFLPHLPRPPTHHPSIYICICICVYVFIFLFCLTILLPTTQAFGSLGNAFIKVNKGKKHRNNQQAQETQNTETPKTNSSKARESFRCWRCWWENLTSRRTSSTRRTRPSSPRSSSSSSSWSWLSYSWISSLVLLSRILASLRGFQRYDKKRKYSNWWNKYLLKHNSPFFLKSDQNLDIPLSNDRDDEHHRGFLEKVPVPSLACGASHFPGDLDYIWFSNALFFFS